MEEKQITLQIDGHFITVPEGSTILEAACKIGINIPTLCHIDLKGTCIKNNPAAKVSATMYRQSAHWEPSAADSTQQ